MLDRTGKQFFFPACRRIRLGAQSGKAPKRVQLMRTGTFWHPEFGKFQITSLDLAEIKKNFDKKVRGVDPAVDYAHESDKKAAAWIRSLEIREEGTESQLWAEVEWTPEGKKIVEGKEYRYLSADLAFKYKDNETLKNYGTVLLGAGLTNRPVIKNMAPTLGLAEGDELETVWLTEYKGQEMAKRTTKKISELRPKELRARLAEEKDEEKKELFRLRLDEMEAADPDDDEDDDDDASDIDPDKASHDELKNAFGKMQKKMGKLAEKLKCMEDDAKKSSDKAALAEKKATFAKMLAEGRAIPAQEEHFLSGDMVKFADAWKAPNFTSTGRGGSPVNDGKSAEDEINEKAQVLLAEKKVANLGEGIRRVMAENPELVAKQQKETHFVPPARA